MCSLAWMAATNKRISQLVYNSMRVRLRCSDRCSDCCSDDWLSSFCPTGTWVNLSFRISTVTFPPIPSYEVPQSRETNWRVSKGLRALGVLQKYLGIQEHLGIPWRSLEGRNHTVEHMGTIAKVHVLGFNGRLINSRCL